MSGIFGAIKDPQFWGDIKGSLASFPQRAYDSLRDYGTIPKRADDIANATFPGSERDASTMNSFRHALGTGMFAQMGRDITGSDTVGAMMASLMGYGWEAKGLKENIQDPAHFLDTKHDLNANAIGSQVAQRTANQAELEARLKRMALEGAVSQPPGIFERSPGYLTRTER